MGVSIRGLLVLVLASIAGCASLSADRPDNIDLTGIWKLNSGMSDDASRVVATLAQTGRQRGNRPGAPGGALPGEEIEVYDRDAGASRGTSILEDGPSLVYRGFDAFAAKELDIEQRDDSTRIDYDQKQLVVYQWGKTSGWDGTRFVIRNRLGRDATIERTFFLSEDGKRLTVVIETGEFSFTQVYDYDAETTRAVYSKR